MKSLRALALSFCAALPFLGTADAAPPTRQELLRKAGEGAAICAATMPNSQTAASTLAANGFAFNDANGSLKAYSALGNGVVVLITPMSSKDKACIVAVAGLSEAEAQQLIGPWLQQSNATPLSFNGPFTHAWTGTFKGGPVELAITRSTDLYYFTGRAILARAAKNP